MYNSFSKQNLYENTTFIGAYCFWDAQYGTILGCLLFIENYAIFSRETLLKISYDFNSKHDAYGKTFVQGKAMYCL